MSFFATRANTIAGLRALQKSICDYGGLPTRCDCKFGITFPRRGGEQNGCCEVVSAIHLLEAMLETEYDDLLHRSGGVSPEQRLNDIKNIGRPVVLAAAKDPPHKHAWIDARSWDWGCSFRVQRGGIEDSCDTPAIIGCDPKKHPKCLFGVCAKHRRRFMSRSVDILLASRDQKRTHPRGD